MSPERVFDPTFSRWSMTGVYCHLTKQNCENCIIPKITTIGNSRTCHQPASNKKLMGYGISIPENYASRIMAELRHRGIPFYAV